jgi:hypothetical protein
MKYDLLKVILQISVEMKFAPTSGGLKAHAISPKCLASEGRSQHYT